MERSLVKAIRNDAYFGIRWLFLVLLVTEGACSTANDKQACPAPIATTLTVGQDWTAAREGARRAGYALEDASQLGMASQHDGFYIDLPQNDGLIVLRDPPRGVVTSMAWVENWQGPKKFRVYHDVKSFDIPAASAAEHAQPR